MGTGVEKIFLASAIREQSSSAPLSARILSVKLPIVKLISTYGQDDLTTRNISSIVGTNSPVVEERETIVCGKHRENSMDNDLFVVRLSKVTVETIQ